VPDKKQDMYPTTTNRKGKKCSKLLLENPIMDTYNNMKVYTIAT